LGGEGEKQIELDRRIIRDRIEFYKKNYRARKARVFVKKEEKSGSDSGAGRYTNAGKSSIMNRLCRVEVLEENKLFATWTQPTECLIDTKPPMIMIDTLDLFPTSQHFN